MFDPFSQQGAGELNVLKRHLQSTVLTLLVNRLANLTLHRRPILTPFRGGVCW